MKKITVDGNEACSIASYLFTDITGIYPITPSSTMAENIEKWSNEGKKNLFGNVPKIVQMQSEAGAIGFVHGALQVGSLASTYTASQGLLLMIPNMYKIAGEMLPGVIHVASRALATHALSIFGDHQDIYATRATGFAMLASSSVQDAYYMSGLAHLSSIKSSIPFLHFFDGFRTSHEINKINILEDDDWKDLIDFKAITNFRKKALIPNNVITKGTAQNDDIYFQNFESRNIYYEKCANIVDNYMEKLNKVAGTNYKPFNYYGDLKATKVIVAMGSVCETIKEVVLNSNDIGLIEVHLYRPFNKEFLIRELPLSVKKIAVLDRTKEIGSIAEPLYLDITNALKDTDIKIIGGRYGLASKDTTVNDIKAVFKNLDTEMKDHFTIGIIDDVTNTSLEVKEQKIKTNNDEYLIYGYGSDGMISASKSIIKIIGNNTDKYVQGYFQYDSKKSGGVTISHLRFSDDIIRSTYYVSNPKGIVITKDSYIKDFINIDNIKEKGFILINTSKDNKELNKYLPDEIREVILRKKIRVYKVDAYEIASNLGLKNKISSIMESLTVGLIDIMDYEKYIEILKEEIFNKFNKKGTEIVKANYQAIDLCVNYLEEVIIDNDIIILDEKKETKNILKAINKRIGNSLPVSAFEKNVDGSFVGGNTKSTKKNISQVVPTWIKDNCIECGMCALLCPHSVIKIYLLDDEEFMNAPDYVKRRCIQPVEKDLQSYYFCLGISIKNCTGCGICIKNCPGKNKEKALEKADIINEIKENVETVSDYLYNNIKEKDIDIKNLIKKYQLNKSRFLYPGACAGCGETPYIKLLTQMFGDSLVIANATGCSSIYGGSSPDTPYLIPWSNSLFEDNAEYGYGIINGVDVIKKQIKELMEIEILKNDENKKLYESWIKNYKDYNITKEIQEKLNYEIMDSTLMNLKPYFLAQTTFIVGGDGWAYDIGFSGLDHIMASNQNVNVLVLDTQSYSNTGGQISKATEIGAVGSFASNGKQTDKKDLAKIFMNYDNAYVAQVSLQANPMQTIKAINEAVNYDGPSIIIAYCPCIAHGIKGGLENIVDISKLAVESGYHLLFRRDPNSKFTLDSKNVDFDKYDEYLDTQTRYKMLKAVNQKHALDLLNQNKEKAIKRYEYYKNLEK